MSIHDPKWKFNPSTNVAETFRKNGFKPTTKAEREQRQIERYGDKRGRIVPENDEQETRAA
jgi:hypothetical protein